jgi:hypothetical protein
VPIDFEQDLKWDVERLAQPRREAQRDVHQQSHAIVAEVRDADPERRLEPPRR